jgi:hypothetical protein
MSKFYAYVLATFVTVSSMWAQSAELPFETDFEDFEHIRGFLTKNPFFENHYTNLNLGSTNPASGSSFLKIMGYGGLEIKVNDSSSSGIRWIDYYVKPIFFSHHFLNNSDMSDISNFVEGLSSAVSTFVSQGGIGRVYVADGIGSGYGIWVACDHSIKLKGRRSKDWLRMTYRLDYLNKRWDLYLDNRLVFFDLRFLDDELTHLEGLNFFSFNTNPTKLDFLYFGKQNPLSLDQDNDGIPDADDLYPFSGDRYLDSDGDGLMNIKEVQLGTALNLSDSDGDGHSDSTEYRWGRDPLKADSDLAEMTSLNEGEYQWATGFESSEGYYLGPLNQQLDWYASSQVVVTDNDSKRARSTTAKTAYVERYFNTSAQSKIWLQFSGKFCVGNLPDEGFDESSAVVFGFSNDHTIQVLDIKNNLWQSYNLPNPATQWARYVIYLDYVNTTWTLYQDGQLVADNLPFADVSVASLNRFRASIFKLEGSSNTSYLDNLKVYSGPDFDADGLDFDFELARGLNPSLNDRSHPEGDFDLDGFKNRVEWRYGTHHLFNYAAENAALQVDTRIEALEPASSLRFFTQQDHSNKAYVRNPEVWCNDIDSITAISPWNSTQGSRRAGTLISPQHLLFAAHYQLEVGASVRFVTKDNQLVERTVIARKTLAGYSSNGRRNFSKDITIGLLNEPLHADIDGIHFVKVLPDDWADYLGPMDYSSFDPYAAMPALCLDYEEKALITDVEYFSNYVRFTAPASEPRRAYYESKIIGDSGNPALLLLNSQGGGAELVLLNVWTFGDAGVGVSVYENKVEINQIMADLEAQKGFIHGYQLTEYDFSGFQALGSL